MDSVLRYIQIKILQVRKNMQGLFFRDLEYEISRFEKICAELTNLKQDWNNPPQEEQLVKAQTKTILKNKVRPKVPPKPKLSTVMKTFMNMEESPGGTEV